MQGVSFHAAASLLILLLFLFAGCAHATPRHVLVVIDQSLFEVLNDVSRAEQQALCQRDVCYDRDEHGGITGIITPITGWSEEKSIAFNRRLRIAVSAGREFNRVLAAWTPGMAMPAQLHDLIAALASSLTQVTMEFPEGTTKTQILSAIGKAQSVVLQSLDFYVSSMAEEPSADNGLVTHGPVEQKKPAPPKLKPTFR